MSTASRPASTSDATPVGDKIISSTRGIRVRFIPPRGGCQMPVSVVRDFASVWTRLLVKPVLFAMLLGSFVPPVVAGLRLSGIPGVVMREGGSIVRIARRLN